MNFGNWIQEKWIRYFVPPFRGSESVDFKNTLRKAKEILVLLSSTPEEEKDFKVLKSLMAIFPNAHFTFLSLNSNVQMPKSLSSASFIVLPPHSTIWQFQGSTILSQVLQEKIDLFFDLDPQFTLLGIYLARRLSPKVSISLVKPYSDLYYTVQYHGDWKMPFSKRWLSFFRFLRTFLREE